MKRDRGSGSLYREKYRDPKSGEMRQSSTWTMKLWVHGKPMKRSSGVTSRPQAVKLLV